MKLLNYEIGCWPMTPHFIFNFQFSILICVHLRNLRGKYNIEISGKHILYQRWRRAITRLYKVRPHHLLYPIPYPLFTIIYYLQTIIFDWRRAIARLYKATPHHLLYPIPYSLSSIISKLLSSIGDVL